MLRWGFPRTERKAAEQAPLYKVYVRDAAELPLAADLLAQRLPASVPRLILHAAVCRRDLRIEIDGVHG